MIMCEQFTLHNPKENIVLRKIRERRLSQWRELKNYLRFTPFFFFSRFIDIVFITSMK